MWISSDWKDYELLDCGGGERLERWGKYLLVRPDPQAIWRPEGRHPGWRRHDARYQRASTGGGQWVKKELPQRWTLGYKGLTLNIKPMNFKHTGVFPEQAANWDFAMERIRSAGRPIRVLNLFAYTGAASVACAAAGAAVCHVDAAKGMVSWARENAASCPTRPSAGSWTTAPSSWSGRSAGAAGTMQSSWTPPPTAGVPPARSGSWRRTSSLLWNW